jgi:hypothetical protein
VFDMGTHTIALEGGTLTRVGYVDVAIPPEVAGLGADELAAIPWSAPLWREGDQLRAGAAAWFADLGGKRLVFDPVQAADDVLRASREVERAQQDALAGLFAGAGFPRESVDLVVLSHIEGVGMVGWRDDAGTWSRFFPNARVLVSDAMLAAFRDTPPGQADLQHEAWSALIAQGVVDTFADGDVLVAGLSAAVGGGHCPGHTVFHFGVDARSAGVSMLGHLAISPLHLAVGERPGQHADASCAWSLLSALASDGRTLIGPLWPSPGYGRLLDGAFEPGGLLPSSP